MSKAGNVQSDTDPNSVTVLRKSGPRTTSLKTASAVSEAKRMGYSVETERKIVGGTNKQHGMAKSAVKLDQETEELKHDTLGLDVGKLIQQTRQAKEMTQKDLAAKINEKPQIVNEYESGKAIPNQQVLSKLERALGVRLRGKEKGEPLVPKAKKK